MAFHSQESTETTDVTGFVLQGCRALPPQVTALTVTNGSSITPSGNVPTPTTLLPAPPSPNGVPTTVTNLPGEPRAGGGFVKKPKPGGKIVASRNHQEIPESLPQGNECALEEISV